MKKDEMLPEGWEIKKLGEVCDFVTDKPIQFSGEKKYYTTKSINNNENYCPVMVTFEKKPGRANLSPKLGDVGFAVMKGTNKVFKIDNRILGGIFSTGFKILRSKSESILMARFLEIFLRSNLFQKKKDELAGNGIMGGISKGDIKNFQLLLPPLEEQKRIVKVLDETFENIEEAKNVAEENLKNAKSLFESYLENVFEEKGEIGIINDALDFLTDYHANGSYKTLKQNVELKDEEDYSLMIRATDLENKNYINGVKYLSEHSYNFLKKSKVYGKEIILPKIGTIGNVYLMPNLNRPVSLGMNLFMLKINEKNEPSYIYYYLISSIGNNKILENAQGAVTKTITKKSVKDMIIPLPNIKKQKEIVEVLDRLSDQVKELEEVYREKSERLEELKRSILERAFAGKL